MKEEPHSKPTSNRSWLDKLSQALLREPQDREQLVNLLRDASDRQLLNPDALHMIEGVLAVSEIQTRDIMIPRSQMAFLDIDSPIEEWMPILLETGHSRFPVFGENKDEVVGVLFAKDLLRFTFNSEQQAFNLRAYLRAPTFVPESKRVDVLLKEFRINRNHMAIVIDEYGGVSGLVTIEDVLEQIVGDIEDEHDITEECYIQQTNIDQYTVNALTPVEEFNQYFNSNLSEEEFDTIGGLVTHSLGHLPKQNEAVCLADYRFQVLQADERRVHLLQLTMRDQDAETPAKEA